MKKLLLLISLLILSTPAFADVSVSITSSGVWPTTVDNTTYSPIYFHIHNNGQNPITLKSMSSPSGTVTLYESIRHELNVPMKPLGPVTIAPDETATFMPEHNCMMLEKINTPLKIGDAIKLTLNFDQGSTTTDIPVLSITNGDGGVPKKTGTKKIRTGSNDPPGE